MLELLKIRKKQNLTYLNKNSALLGIWLTHVFQQLYSLLSEKHIFNCLSDTSTWISCWVFLFQNEQSPSPEIGLLFLSYYFC